MCPYIFSARIFSHEIRVLLILIQLVKTLPLINWNRVSCPFQIAVQRRFDIPMIFDLKRHFRLGNSRNSLKILIPIYKILLDWTKRVSYGLKIKSFISSFIICNKIYGRRIWFDALNVRVRLYLEISL